jgi:hypothetical protein
LLGNASLRGLRRPEKAKGADVVRHRQNAADASGIVLFLAVLLGMGLNCLFGVPSGMNHVGPRGVSVVCRLFVMSRVVMLGGFPVVAGGMRKMF